MKIFLTSMTSLMLSMLALKHFLSNRRQLHPDDSKKRILPYVDLAVLFNVICGLFTPDRTNPVLVPGILMGLTVLYMLSVSFIPYNRVIRNLIYLIIGTELITGLWSLSTIFGMPPLPCALNVIIPLILTLLIIYIYIYGIYMKIKDVKCVMKSGSVWSNVTLSVDSVYILIILLVTEFYIASYLCSTGNGVGVMAVFTIIFSSIYIALSVRLLNSSVFVFMTNHERKIIESMRMSHIDSSADSSGTALLYKNLYDRVLEYFVESKPYLNPNLTINDVVSVVFSNKLYISRAISKFTGRNFCQFVNYYRIVHAIEQYRNNTDLKVIELAVQSGFNSAVSFGMAFKLYMGEKPGDWCRREKIRLDKLKK